jgi:hypothetical protein
LPAAAIGLGTWYWGYNKKKHNEVNQTIWEWWHGNTQEGALKKPDALLSEVQARKWLAWFGAEGFYNMNYLGGKVEKAKGAYNDAVNNLRDSLGDLGRKIQLASVLREPQLTQTLQQLRREAETLAGKYLEPAKPLEYLRYRLERTLMYNQMLLFAAHSLIHMTKDHVDKVAKDTIHKFDEQIDSYDQLRGVIAGLDREAA